jgi:hypothetical protein
MDGVMIASRRVLTIDNLHSKLSNGISNGLMEDNTSLFCNFGSFGKWRKEKKYEMMQI